MTDRVIDCDELESLLPEYLEGGLDAARTRTLRRHIEGCARCAALLHDIAAIVDEARELPALTPSRDLWPGIEARIQPDIVPLGTAHADRAGRAGRDARVGRDARAGRTTSRRSVARLAAAAAALVASTAGVTYVVTTHAGAARTTVAAGTSTDSGSSRSRASDAAGAPSGVLRNASILSSEQLYDREIAQLQTIMRERSSVLDTTTVKVIERNLAIIDSAIAQSRAALAADPNSRFLNEQLNSVLGQKVELLRTAALLPART